MRPALKARLEAAAAGRVQAGVVRTRVTGQDFARRHRPPDGWLDFCGNDYLGLAGHPALAAALAGYAGTNGTGARASPLVSGYRSIHHRLEAALADFLGFEAACLFPSGYQANLAVGQALLGRGELALADRLNHASLNDGLRLAGARIRRYAHVDRRDLADRAEPRVRMLVSDGVFSMDGDCAPLATLVEFADRLDAGLWLDDAHGLGVLGATGRGLMEVVGVGSSQIDVFVGTFGKAFGTAGAFVAGDRRLIEHLENTARGLIYSTALAPPLAAATLAALERVRADDWRRKRLVENIGRFRAGAVRLGLPMLESDTPIQPLLLGRDSAAVERAAALARRGCRVAPIRPPTVPVGTARLRITLSAAHAPHEIDRLLEALEQVWV